MKLRKLINNTDETFEVRALSPSLVVDNNEKLYPNDFFNECEVSILLSKHGGFCMIVCEESDECFIVTSETMLKLTRFPLC